MNLVQAEVLVRTTADERYLPPATRMKPGNPIAAPRLNRLKSTGEQPKCEEKARENPSRDTKPTCAAIASIVLSPEVSCPAARSKRSRSTNDDAVSPIASMHSLRKCLREYPKSNASCASSIDSPVRPNSVSRFSMAGAIMPAISVRRVPEYCPSSRDVTDLAILLFAGALVTQPLLS